MQNTVDDNCQNYHVEHSLSDYLIKVRILVMRFIEISLHRAHQ